jgi:hypothetical protein
MFSGSTSGTVALWAMKGLAIGSVGAPGAVVDANWKILK